MHQKWLNTILFGSGQNLVTLKHDLEPIYCCFITYFGVGSSPVPSGAPWCPLAPPWVRGAPGGHSTQGSTVCCCSSTLPPPSQFLLCKTVNLSRDNVTREVAKVKTMESRFFAHHTFRKCHNFAITIWKIHINFSILFGPNWELRFKHMRTRLSTNSNKLARFECYKSWVCYYEE